jgi:hypothetical protein
MFRVMLRAVGRGAQRSAAGAAEDFNKHGIFGVGGTAASPVNRNSIGSDKGKIL